MKAKFNAKKVAIAGLFLALALIVSLIESYLPPIIPVLPYAKIGLGNVVLLACFLCLGVWEGYVVLVFVRFDRRFCRQLYCAFVVASVGFRGVHGNGAFVQNETF